MISKIKIVTSDQIRFQGKFLLLESVVKWGRMKTMMRIFKMRFKIWKITSMRSRFTIGHRFLTASQQFKHLRMIIIDLLLKMHK